MISVPPGSQAGPSEESHWGKKEKDGNPVDTPPKGGKFTAKKRRTGFIRNPEQHLGFPEKKKRRRGEGEKWRCRK